MSESTIPLPLAVLEHAAVGAPITRAGVSLFPVYLFQPSDVSLLVSNATTVEITEADEEVVPILTVTSTADDPVLLVEGETVAGGLQQRCLNVSVLVPPRARLEVLVSCVEAGRWGGSRGFSGASGQTSRRVRRAKVDGVHRNLQRTGRKDSDQGAVWQSVDRELDRLDLAAPTRNFADTDTLFADAGRLRAALEELVARGPLSGQCGVVIAHGSVVVAAELFATPALLAARWETTVRAAIVDSPIDPHGRPSASKALGFLRRIGRATSVEADGVGLGREHHLRSKRLVGQVLTWDDLVVHASAFALAA